MQLDADLPDRPRPLWLAAAAGGLAAVTIAWLLVIGPLRMMIDDEGQTPALTLSSAVIAYWRLTALALPYVVALIVVMSVVERGTPKPLRTWLLAGAAAMIPGALAWTGHLLLLPGTVAPPPSAYAIPAAIFCALGATGGAVASRVRDRGRWP